MIHGLSDVRQLCGHILLLESRKIAIRDTQGGNMLKDLLLPIWQHNGTQHGMSLNQLP